MIIILLITLIAVLAIYILTKPSETRRQQTIYEIENQIQQIDGNKAVIKNVRTICEGHFGNIDDLIIHEQGIYLIYFTKTNGKRIDNRYKNKWIVSKTSGSEYIPNYIAQSDYDIIFLAKILNLYKHNFRVIIALGDDEYLAYPTKQLKSIRIVKKKMIMQLLKKMINENIVLYNNTQIETMKSSILEAEKEVNKKICNIGQL